MLTVIGVVVGGCVFALTGDVVMGVGVGAAAVVATRQGTKVWGTLSTGSRGPAPLWRLGRFRTSHDRAWWLRRCDGPARSPVPAAQDCRSCR